MTRSIGLLEAIRMYGSTRRQKETVPFLWPRAIEIGILHPLLSAIVGWVVFCAVSQAADPLPINPFGPKTTTRDDALPGYIEMSDGMVHPGQVYLTRDVRLEIFDEELQRQREIPLSAVKQIECTVAKEWMEKEWKFQEAASSEKVYTGQTYPVREYLHTITLNDDRTITGPLSAIVYLQPYTTTTEGPPPTEPERYLLNKRNKGEVGEKLASLVYVKQIKLGEAALAEGREKAAKQQSE